MRTTTVNISFQKDFLKQIDQLAREESRSRSELIREATRAYMEKKAKWKKIFDVSEKQAERVGLSEKDIKDEIINYRSRKNE
ncbi:CopG family ribbon-helix-helix protein [candidate division CSSED10-310 bacterium]|uniref:CopG family ribbon-helix-helix protein n=1 Tax=candidate division CSSED10-310 bacterium TaxID=2855610 RepID=A0ABV6YUJ3_UNCC1